jgi:aspartyl-tRNA(Asn)/glutamyl-tRNA(Gln) amidotransferase subunit A
MPQTVDLAYLSIAEAGALFRRRELSPVELVNALLDRSERLQETLVPYVTLTPELARQQARTAESAFLQGDSASPLLGIPIAYKDIVMTKGIRTTCGSALHEDWRPAIDAAVVEQWRAAGAVMMGKLSTHEFAFGLQPPGHMLKPARNPCRSYAVVESRIKKGIESPWGGKTLCLSHSGYTSWPCCILLN